MDSNANNPGRTFKQRKRNIIWYNHLLVKTYPKNWMIFSQATRQSLSSRPEISQNFEQKQYKT